MNASGSRHSILTKAERIHYRTRHNIKQQERTLFQANSWGLDGTHVPSLNSEQVLFMCLFSTDMDITNTRHLLFFFPVSYYLSGQISCHFCITSLLVHCSSIPQSAGERLVRGGQNVGGVLVAGGGTRISLTLSGPEKRKSLKDFPLVADPGKLHGFLCPHRDPKSILTFLLLSFVYFVPVHDFSHRSP